MSIETLEKFVDDMIVQSDYPGYDPRSLKIGLTQELEKAPTKMFGEALLNQSIYVQLAAIRWFQERPGYLKPYVKKLLALLDSEDYWVRLESIRALERMTTPSEEIACKISSLLFDKEIEVQKAAARGLGKVGKRLKIKDGEVVEALNKAALDGENEVRRKAEKALRKMGVYDS